MGQEQGIWKKLVVDSCGKVIRNWSRDFKRDQGATWVVGKDCSGVARLGSSENRKIEAKLRGVRKIDLVKRATNKRKAWRNSPEWGEGAFPLDEWRVNKKKDLARVQGNREFKKLIRKKLQKS